jgi:hypothetical protein
VRCHAILLGHYLDGTPLNPNLPARIKPMLEYRLQLQVIATSYATALRLDPSDKLGACTAVDMDEVFQRPGILDGVKGRVYYYCHSRILQEGLSAGPVARQGWEYGKSLQYLAMAFAQSDFTLQQADARLGVLRRCELFPLSCVCLSSGRS